MTFLAPVFMDGPATDAQLARAAYGALIGSAGGTIAAGGLACSQRGTPNLSVIVAGGTPAEGAAFVWGTTTTSQGPYMCWLNANFEQVIAAAGATNPRVDTVIARVYDNAVDSSGKTEWKTEVIKGAEESGATLANKKGVGAVPASSLVLAYVLVPAKASSIVTADIENVATPYSMPQIAVGQTYKSQLRAFATLYETTRAALVTVTVETTAEGTKASCAVHVGRSSKGVGGEVAGETKFQEPAGGTGGWYQSITFLVPAGQKYEYVGSAAAVFDSYILL